MERLDVQPARLTANPSVVAHWREKLSALGLTEKKFVLIHPGMAGSARNWPASQYKKLAEQLIQRKIPVVVTGAAVDEKFLRETEILKTPGVHDLTNQTDGPAILALIHLAGAVACAEYGRRTSCHLSSTDRCGHIQPGQGAGTSSLGTLGKRKESIRP